MFVRFLLLPALRAAGFFFRRAQSAFNLEILRRFNAEGLDFAFPTSTTYLAVDPKNPVAVNTGVKA